MVKDGAKLPKCQALPLIEALKKEWLYSGFGFQEMLLPLVPIVSLLVYGFDHIYAASIDGPKLVASFLLCSKITQVFYSSKRENGQCLLSSSTQTRKICKKVARLRSLFYFSFSFWNKKFIEKFLCRNKNRRLFIVKYIF